MPKLAVIRETVLIATVLIAAAATTAAPGESPLADSSATASAPVASQWNQWRGSNRDGTAPGNTLPTSLSDQLKLTWEKPLGPSYSGPVISGDLVYTTETVDQKFEAVTAYRIDDGQQVWRTQWPGSMVVFPIAAANGDWIRSTPACDGDALVVMGMRDVLVCLDAKTGDERWRIDFPKSLKNQMPIFGAVCSPLIDGDAVYVQTGGPTVKVALSDGEIIWQAMPSGENRMSAGAFSSPAIANIGGVRQLLVQKRTELCGVDMENGDVFWSQPIKSFRGMNILTPTVIDDQIFTAAHSGQSQMWQVSHDENGQWSVDEKWSQKTQGYMSSPIVIDDQIYLHAKNQRLVALAATDGSIRWTGKPMGKYWSMIQSDGRILALSNDGKLRLINHDTKSLQIADQMTVGDDSWAYLAMDQNYIVVRDLKALKVYSFNGDSENKNIAPIE